MRQYKLTITCPQGALLVGGHQAAGQGETAAHATDETGRPIIPASALRGALRQSLEVWLRGMADTNNALDLKEPICHAGLPPEDKLLAPGEAIERSCRLCWVCRLFGGAGSEIPDGQVRYSPLIVEDAFLGLAHEVKWSTRHGNAINRSRRSVEENLLYTQRVARLAPEAQFEAKIWLSEAETPLTFNYKSKQLGLHDLLNGATRATTHLGAGRSRGLGRVDMSLTTVRTPNIPTTLKVSKGATSLSLGFTLKTQACIASPISRNNVTDTRDEIPGATIRGTIGFALAEQLGKDLDQADLDRMLDPKSGILFDFAYPVDSEGTANACPLPLTALTCKSQGRDHDLVDDLIPRLLYGASDKAPTQALGCGHKNCDAPLTPATGYRGLRGGLRKRDLTRTALNRSQDSARESALFTQTLLLPGARFEGSLRNISAGDATRVFKALNGPLTVGKGRSRGWGQVEVTVAPTAACTAIKERVEDFREALSGAGATTTELGHRLIVITAQSPVVPRNRNPDRDEVGDSDLRNLPGLSDLLDQFKVLAPELSAQIKPILTVQRYALEGVWVQRNASDDDIKDRRMQVVVAGSVFVVELQSGSNTDAHVLELLAKLEDQGIGRRQTQGFGRIMAFDPIHNDFRLDGTKS